jgi:hypothetical protein
VLSSFTIMAPIHVYLFTKGRLAASIAKLQKHNTDKPYVQLIRLGEHEHDEPELFPNQVFAAVHLYSLQPVDSLVAPSSCSTFRSGTPETTTNCRESTQHFQLRLYYTTRNGDQMSTSYDFLHYHQYLSQFILYEDQILETFPTFFYLHGESTTNHGQHFANNLYSFSLGVITTNTNQLLKNIIWHFDDNEIIEGPFCPVKLHTMSYLQK